jgi:hypothetical protein
LRSGQRCSHSAALSGWSGEIVRNSNGVPFSYSAISAFQV